MKLQFRAIDPCPAVHPKYGEICGGERGHDGDHWYTVWAPGDPCEPGCYGDCEYECRAPYPAYPVTWDGAP